MQLTSRARALGMAALQWAAITVFFPGQATAQDPSYYLWLATPSSPLSPTTRQQCSAFEQAWTSVCRQISNDHQACLDAHRDDRVKTPGARGCDIDACDHLHGSCGALGAERDAAIAACNDSVDAHEKEERLREEQERQRLDDEERAKREAAERAARDKQARDDAQRRQREEQARERERRDRDAVFESLQDARNSNARSEAERQRAAADAIAEAERRAEQAGEDYREFERTEMPAEVQLEQQLARFPAITGPEDAHETGYTPGVFDFLSAPAEDTPSAAFASDPAWIRLYEHAKESLSDSFRELAQSAAKDTLETTRQELLHIFIEQADESALIEQMLDTAEAPASAGEWVVKHTFDRLMGPVEDVTDDVSAQVARSLRPDTDPERVRHAENSVIAREAELARARAEARVTERRVSQAREQWASGQVSRADLAAAERAAQRSQAQLQAAAGEWSQAQAFLTEKRARFANAPPAVVQWMGDAVVKQSFRTVIAAAAEQIRAQVVAKVNAGFNSVFDRANEPPPPEGTYDRAVHDFWEDASVPSLLSRSAPFRGAAAAAGILDYGTNLVNRLAIMLGFAADEAEEQR